MELLNSSLALHPCALVVLSMTTCRAGTDCSYGLKQTFTRVPPSGSTGGHALVDWMRHKRKDAHLQSG